MMDPEAGAKLQLAEAHRYVKQFLTLRSTFFGAYLTADVSLLTVIAKLEPDAKFQVRLGLWAVLATVQVLGTQTVGSATRAIWLFCCHMFLLERNVYGPGGNHQWLLTNLRDNQYSTTFGLYRAIVMLPIATLGFFLVDVSARADASCLAKAVAIPVAAVVWLAVIYMSHHAMNPAAVIAGAANQAVQNERQIAMMESMGDDLLRADQSLPTPYVNLLLRSRLVVAGRPANASGEVATRAPEPAED